MRDSQKEKEVKEMVEEHFEYALKLASEFRGQREGRFASLDIRDLESAALLGLCEAGNRFNSCLLYTSPSPRDATLSRMPSSA